MGQRLTRIIAQEIKYSNGTYFGEVAGVGASRRRHGRGVNTLSCGERYEGEWREDKRSGRGVFTWSDG